jgi:CubicO group peptidase (beta-lactamase class C family)
MIWASSEMLSRILDHAVETGVTPGGVLVAGDQNRDVLQLPFGHVAPGEGAVTLDTVYDIASLTKPIATVTALMRLCEQREIGLDENVPGLGPITFRHLAGHAAGFPAHVPFYERLRAGDRAGIEHPNDSARDALLAMALATGRIAQPGTQALYSDVGFILLGGLIERHTGERLDRLVRAWVTEPLGMQATRFVDLESQERTPFRVDEVAPTEACPVRGLVRGEVHDENAHAAGGICGHAGLFSTGTDVAAFARAMCLAWQGKASVVAGAVVREFFTSSAAPGTTWRLGWDRPAPGDDSHAGDLWPRSGVGHLAFTGCSMWLDPPHGRYVVLLTNRVHPTRHRPGIKELRRAVMDAVVRAYY